MPLGQMPLLEIDGKRIHQSISICRYLARQIGLAGSTDMESFEIDSVVDTCNDFRLSE
jgi:prostaglandin-H2 D-isomerase / glutathione transferase